MMKWSILISVLVTGCSMGGGQVVDEDLNKLVTCVDTRDGETIQFNTNNITNIRNGIGVPDSFDYVDINGNRGVYTTDMEAWMKCTKEPA